MQPTILGVIPARYASTRLPAKALADIDGKPMVQRVYEQACQASRLHRVVVATDHPLIFDTVKGFGGEVVMTSPDHRNGTERCREALDLQPQRYDYVVNIQGDEPFIQPEQLDEIAALLDGQTELATLVGAVKHAEDLFNPSIMKVVFDRHMNALYFSRECIPHLRGVEKADWFAQGQYHKHIAIYAYRADVLFQVTQLDPTPLELAESLEQLRWLENGFRIKIGISAYESLSVDTPADLEKARLKARQMAQ